MPVSQSRPAKKAPAKRAPAKRAAAKRRPGAKKHWIRRILIAVVILAGVAVGGFALIVAMTPVPAPSELATAQATTVFYSDGTTVLGSLGESTRHSVSLATVPLGVQRAVLAAEDRSFYSHGGVSPLGIGRALLNDVSGGRLQGGSTITQQYAKNAFLTQDRTISRKLKEVVLAFKLETVVSKNQILEDYLNTIYFGRGAYGIDAAAGAYFGKPASQLTVAEGAMLASIIRSPSGLNPDTNLPGLKARWNYVLDGMVSQGWLTQSRRDAMQFPQTLKLHTPNRLGGQVGYMLGIVQHQLESLGFSAAQLQAGGLQITSTFDKTAEDAAIAAVAAKGPKTHTKGLRIGLAAVQPGTGHIMAIYGGKDFITNQLDNATRQFAQAGSTFKPFALAAAFGQGLSLGSMWNGSSPQTINGYTLSNYGNESYGLISLLKATENSVNTAYVNLEKTIGVQTVADAALAAGVPESVPGLNLNNLDLTFVLGTASPSALDMASAYSTFAAQGVQTKMTAITKVVGANGGLLYTDAPQQKQAFPADVANSVSYTLNQVIANGTGYLAAGLGRPAAGKTGTTDGNKSAWFVGYTPQLATAVMMAKDDASKLPGSLSGTGGMAKVTGGSFPTAIWTAFMSQALASQPVAQFPAPAPGLVFGSRCPQTIPTDGSALPVGCPTPTAMNFGPSQGTSGGTSGNGDTAPNLSGGDTGPAVAGVTATPTTSPTATPTNAATHGAKPTAKPAGGIDGPPQNEAVPQ